MAAMPEEIPNSLLLEEIRENRGAIKTNRELIAEWDKAMGNKVGRAELFGWIGASVSLFGMYIVYLNA